MNQTVIVIAAAIAVIALLLLFILLRGRRQHVRFGGSPSAVPPPPPATPSLPEDAGIGPDVGGTNENVVDRFVGPGPHPSGSPLAPGDPLTQLKGLGPRAATLLAELGVTRFDQIASWSGEDAAMIDARMGAFKGRIARDRWVDQAKLLANGDRDRFEAEFGNLGG